MKNLTKIALLTLLISLMSFTVVSEWKLFKNEKAGFQIQFPNEPTLKESVVNTQIGALKVSNFILDTSNSKGDFNLLYGVSFTEYPQEFIEQFKEPEQINNLFTNSINGSVNNVHGKLLSEKIIELNGKPGREIKINFQNGLAIIKQRAYLVNNKMYIIQTITETSKDFNKSINKFMDSFTLIEK